jgi:hypothetical protein
MRHFHLGDSGGENVPERPSSYFGAEAGERSDESHDAVLGDNFNIQLYKYYNFSKHGIINY